jgi:hypothetical protein
MALTMRATVERDRQASRDPYGGAGAPDFQLALMEPCYVYVRSRLLAVVVTRTVRVSELRIMLRAATDVLEGDRITVVKDRIGRDIFEGPYLLKSFEKRASHCEATLEQDSDAIGARMAG